MREHRTERVLSRADVQAGVTAILRDSLGVETREIRPSASLVRDLGAESIDFLDLGFRIQEAFGVDLRTAEIHDRIVGWGRIMLHSLAEVLSAHFRTAIAPRS